MQTNIMPHCPGTHYPRLMERLLTQAERRSLAGVYHREVPVTGSKSLPYLIVLRDLLRGAPGSNETSAVLRRLHAHVAAVLGRRFVIVADLYSYRAPGLSLFSYPHQDVAFWMTGSACSSFNLWLMLEHNEMPYSFHIWEHTHNPDLYDGKRAGCSHEPQMPYMCNPGRYRGDYPVRVENASSVKMHAGDGLVLKQAEIHQTDSARPLAKTQWRLALILKFVEEVPIIANSTGIVASGRRIFDAGPLPAAHENLLREHPHLPRALAGRPFPNWYT